MTHSNRRVERDAHLDSCENTCPLAAGALRAQSAQLDATRMRLDRRGFLTQSMLVAAAAALAACGAGGFESITAPASINSTVNLSSYPALATVGGIALTSINGAALALVRTGATSFVALSRACPHEGTTLGTNSSGGFTCPRHGARFNDSGTWIGGQRTTGMHSYPVTYDATAGTLAIG